MRRACVATTCGTLGDVASRARSQDAGASLLRDTLLQAIAGHADLVTAVAWSPDGSMLASTAGGPLVSLATNDLSTGPDMAVRFWRSE